MQRFWHSGKRIVVGHAQLKRVSRQNKEKCAEFIEKYGKEVLEEIQKEEKEHETSSETPTTI